jgi:hypothetical protein
MASPIFSHFAKLLDRGTIDLPAVNAPLAGALAALNAGLAAKAPLDSAALTGVPTAPTAAPGTNTTQLATTAFTQSAISSLIAAAPGALDTLDELAAALGDDANFASTVTNSLAGKQPLAANLTSWSALARGAGFDTAAALAVNAAGGFFTQGSALSASTVAASGNGSFDKLTFSGIGGATGQIGVSSTGFTFYQGASYTSARVTLSSGGLDVGLGSSKPITWSSSLVGLTCTSSGVLAIYDGSTITNYRDLLLRNITAAGSATISSDFLVVAPYLRATSFVQLGSSGPTWTYAGTTMIASGEIKASGSLTGSQATSTLDLSPTWNTTGNPTLIYGRVTNTASGASANFIDFGTVAGGSLFKVSKWGEVTAANYLNALGGLQTSQSQGLSMDGTIYLKGEGAGVFVQRNGTNAQTSRLYGTYTDASNYRRFSLASTTAGRFTLSAQGAGTGASGNEMVLASPVITPAASATPSTNGDLLLEATSNTTVTAKLKGSDGTVRSCVLTFT